MAKQRKSSGVGLEQRRGREGLGATLGVGPFLCQGCPSHNRAPTEGQGQDQQQTWTHCLNAFDIVHLYIKIEVQTYIYTLDGRTQLQDCR